jgi:hypothetical protein
MSDSSRQPEQPKAKRRFWKIHLSTAAALAISYGFLAPINAALYTAVAESETNSGTYFSVLMMLVFECIFLVAEANALEERIRRRSKS